MTLNALADDFVAVRTRFAVFGGDVRLWCVQLPNIWRKHVDEPFEERLLTKKNCPLCSTRTQMQRYQTPFIVVRWPENIAYRDKFGYLAVDALVLMRRPSFPSHRQSHSKWPKNPAE